MNKAATKAIIFLVAVAVLLVGTTVITAKNVRASKSEKMQEEMREDPKAYGGLNRYKMHEFCDKNAKAAMKALKSGNKKKLESLLTDSEGLDAVMDFADWSEADFDNAVAMGSGSLMAEPTEKGLMDISDRFFVEVGDQKYLLFVETLTSEWGRKNSGISALGVTTFEYFDATGYTWNGEEDDQCAVAGKAFWNE